MFFPICTLFTQDLAHADLDPSDSTYAQTKDQMYWPKNNGKFNETCEN